MKKAIYLSTAFVLCAITTPVMASTTICMTDGFGYVWTITGTHIGGGVFNLSGTVKVSDSDDWIVTGVGYANTNTVSITATNPFPDFCTLNADHFTYDGTFISKTMSGTWTNNCGNSGTWAGTYQGGGCPTPRVESANVIDGPARPHGQSSGSVALRNVELSGSDFLDEELSIESYPNPVNTQANISYTLLEDNLVKIAIYNSLGEQIAVLVNAQQTAGSYSIKWNVNDAASARMSSGVYFVRLQTKYGIQSTAITVE